MIANHESGSWISWPSGANLGAMYRNSILRQGYCLNSLRLDIGKFATSVFLGLEEGLRLRWVWVKLG